jgi:adenylylsulfate kinase
LISPFRKDRDKVRNNLGSDRFVEIYLDCPIEECEKRDVKGHYKSARQGKIKDFTGVSSPYEPPLNPELSLRTSTDNIESCVDKVISYLVKFSHIFLES